MAPSSSGFLKASDTISLFQICLTKLRFVLILLILSPPMKSAPWKMAVGEVTIYGRLQQYLEDSITRHTIKDWISRKKASEDGCKALTKTVFMFCVEISKSGWCFVESSMHVLLKIFFCPQNSLQSSLGPRSPDDCYLYDFLLTRHPPACLSCVIGFSIFFSAWL